MGKKRIICIGYSVEFFTPENIGTTNIQLPKGEDLLWKKNIANLARRIKKGEIRLVVLILSDQLIDAIEELETFETFRYLITTIIDVKTIVLIKENLLKDEFYYYDFKDKTYIGINEIQAKIAELDLEIESERKLNKIKLEEIEKLELNFSLSDQYFNEVLEVKRKKDAIEERVNYLLNWKKTYNDQFNLGDKFRKQKELIGKTIAEINNHFDEQYVYDFAKNILKLINDRVCEIISIEFFSFYVLHSDKYSEEIGDFIQLFENYLRNVENLNVSLNIQKTSKGTLFVIKDNDGKVSSDMLSNTLKRFGVFVDLCGLSPERAMELLKKEFPHPEKALEIVRKIGTKYKRLLLDVQHTKEKLELNRKQEIESGFLELRGNSRLVPFIDTSFQFEQNVHPKDIYTASEDVEYDTEEKELLRLAGEHADINDRISIKSNLDLINDPEIGIWRRKISKVYILRFLKSMGQKGIKNVERVVIEVIASYIGNKL